MQPRLKTSLENFRSSSPFKGEESKCQRGEGIIAQVIMLMTGRGEKQPRQLDFQFTVLMGSTASFWLQIQSVSTDFPGIL